MGIDDEFLTHGWRVAPTEADLRQIRERSLHANGSRRDVELLLAEIAYLHGVEALLRDVIETVRERGEDAEREASTSGDLFDAGRALAYRDVLDHIETEVAERQMRAAPLGLVIDGELVRDHDRAWQRD